MVGVAIVKGLLVVAVPKDLPNDQLLEEIKVVLLAYLRAFLRREGHPLPEGLG